MQSGAHNKKHRALDSVLWTLVAVGIGFRIVNPFFNNPSDFVQSDAFRHFLSAKECLQTGTHAWTVFDIVDPLGYQIWLSAVLRITGAERNALAIYAAGLSILISWFWYQWMKLSIGNKRLALVGYAWLSLLPDWTRVFQFYLQETLILPLVGLSLWISWKTAQRPTLAKFAGTGAAWGFTLLTKITALPMAAVALLWLCWKTAPNLKKAELQKLKSPILAILIALMIYSLGPIKVFNRIHAFVPIPGGDLHQVYYESGKSHLIYQITFLDLLLGHRTYQMEVGNPSMDLQLPAPLSFKTTRSGTCETKVDYTRGFGNYFPASQMSFQDRLHYTWENNLYFFFGLSWPEDLNSRADELGSLNEIMKSVRFIWLPLTLAIIFLTVKRRRLNVMTALFYASLLFFMFQQSVIMEARYKKPWEGVAIATFLALLAAPPSRKKAQSEDLTDLDELTPLKQADSE
jgi:hypothetical protein